MRRLLRPAFAGFLLAGLCLLAPSLTGATPVLFGVTFHAASDPTPDQLLRFDTATGAGSVVGDLDSRMQAFGLGTRNNHLYAYDSLASRLRELDPTTGHTTGTIDVGTSGLRGEGGFDFGSDGMGFLSVSLGATGQLWSLDPDAGTATLVTAGLDPSMDGLAFQPGTNTLFGISQTTYVLYVIDPSNGAVTKIGHTGVQSGISLAGLAFAPDGSLFLAAAGQLYTLDPADGAATPVGASGFGNVSGLAFVDVPEGEPIPEPATVLLLGGGLLGLAAWTGRRRA